MNADLLTPTPPLTAALEAKPPTEDAARAAPSAGDAARVEKQHLATEEVSAAEPTPRRPKRADGGKGLADVRLDIQVENDGLVVVKVRDAKTDKVVREIPPEELVEFGRKMRQMLGLLMDRTA